MQLNSLLFILFFSIVFILYYCRSEVRWQNVLLLFASYFFYGYIDWKMLPLILGMTLLFYYTGAYIGKLRKREEDKKAYWTTTVLVIIGLLPLLYFKYFNFFVDSVVDFLSLFGFQNTTRTLNVLMPLGISFFTFRLISYAIEVNRSKMEPSTDFVAFATYVAFFPTIMSGPIDRPGKFLGQINEGRKPEYDFLYKGLILFVWGWFIKVCIADRMAKYTGGIFDVYDTANGTSLLIASLLYPFEMYADFSGYSCMAIGVGKMLGIDVAENFRRPFFAQNIAEYWRRWHMSLTSWLTDYVFMPLNVKFRNLGNWGIILAAIINMIVVGFWHGDNWTYGLFGLYHGLLFIPIVLSGGFGKKKKIKWINGWIIPPKVLLNMLLTYLLVAIGLVIFRAPSVAVGVGILKGIVSSVGVPSTPDVMNIIVFVIFGLVLIVKDYLDENNSRWHLLDPNRRISTNITLFILIICIILFRADMPKPFVYIQF